jgi:hypothetical protein
MVGTAAESLPQAHGLCMAGGRGDGDLTETAVDLQDGRGGRTREEQEALHRTRV